MPLSFKFCCVLCDCISTVTAKGWFIPHVPPWLCPWWQLSFLFRNLWLWSVKLVFMLCASWCRQIEKVLKGTKVTFPHQLFINNEFIDAADGGTFDTICPSDEQVCVDEQWVLISRCTLMRRCALMCRCIRSCNTEVLNWGYPNSVITGCETHLLNLLSSAQGSWFEYCSIKTLAPGYQNLPLYVLCWHTTINIIVIINSMLRLY